MTRNGYILGTLVSLEFIDISFIIDDIEIRRNAMFGFIMFLTNFSFGDWWHG